MSFSNGGQQAPQNTSNVSIPQLIGVTQGTNNNDRNAATSQLKYLEESHFASYLLELVRILGSSSETESVRQGAGLLLKNCVGGNRSAEFVSTTRTRWQRLDKKIRSQIKEGLLSILGVSSRNARSTAVNVISNLAIIESLREWNSLLPHLISLCLSPSASSRNDSLMYSALKCMGQIAENSSSHSELKEYCGKMLECIAHGMSASTRSVQIESMKCLYHILFLISSNLSIEKERRIIFQMVCCGGATATNSTNKSETETETNSETHCADLSLWSFMCISRLCEHYYDLLKPFMQSIFEITKNAICFGVENANNSHINLEITKQAIEVWSTTAEVEYSRSANGVSNFGFVCKSLELLVPIYLRALLQQKEEFDADEWTVRKAAACCLEEFALVSADHILSYVLSFVEQHIGKSEWRSREAALCAFGCVLDGPSTEKLCHLVSQILGAILSLMGDDHAQVRTSAVWTFGRICELIPSATDTSKSANSVSPQQMLATVVHCLNDNCAIANKACWCIASLTKCKHLCIYGDRDHSTAYNLISELLRRRQRSDTSCTLIIGIHEAINGVIYGFADESSASMMKSLLPELVQQMSEICETDEVTEKGEYKLAGLLSSIQVILDKLGEGCLSSALTNRMMHCLVKCTHCAVSNSLVYEEALGLLTHISRCISCNFHIYLQSDSIQELLIKSIRCGLNATLDSEIEICRIGVGVAGDVYTHCAEFISSTEGAAALQSYTDRIVSELLTILINNAIGIELKSHIVDALTDILIAHGPFAHRYSADILDKCLTIGCLTPPTNCDDEMIAIFNEIRCSIIDTTRSCLAELANANKMSHFEKYIFKINEFFQAIANDLPRCDMKLLKSAIRLLSEAADYCQSQKTLKKQLRTQYIHKILQRAGNVNIDTDAQLAKDAMIAFQQISHD